MKNIVWLVLLTVFSINAQTLEKKSKPFSEQRAFVTYESGFHTIDKTIDKYVDTAVLKMTKRYYGGHIIKFERPQLRLKDGKSAYLYVASDHHIYGGESTIIYVLKLIKKLTHEKPTQSA